MATQKAPPLDSIAVRWLHEDQRARAIINANFRVIWRNMRAQTLFAQCSDLEFAKGRLNLRDALHQEELHELIKSADDAPRYLTLPSASRGGHLIVIVEALQVQESEESYFGMTFLETEAKAKVAFAPLNTAFELTNAEQAILLNMLEGNTANDYASKTGLSIETVRSHIKSVYAKMGVSSREALFAKAMRYRI